MGAPWKLRISLYDSEDISRISQCLQMIIMTHMPYPSDKRSIDAGKDWLIRLLMMIRHKWDYIDVAMLLEILSESMIAPEWSPVYTTTGDSLHTLLFKEKEDDRSPGQRYWTNY